MQNKYTSDLVDKFNYLRVNFLTPLESIKSFDVAADKNFKVVENLQERYGRKYFLTNVHVNTLLFRFFKYSSDTKFLRIIYTEIQTRSVESSDISLDTYGILLCPVFLKILPRDLIIEFA